MLGLSKPEMVAHSHKSFAKRMEQPPIPDRSWEHTRPRRFGAAKIWETSYKNRSSIVGASFAIQPIKPADRSDYD
jgi:hypothetical protein